MKHGIEKPHIKWSKYWQAWSARQGQVERIGPLPSIAANELRLALIRGLKR
jgi:hypothetical protein